MDMASIMEDYESYNKVFNNEGSRGVKNLCKLVRVLGYSDPQHFGQFEGGCYGDLIAFLEDNSGVIEAIKNWISEREEEEWKVSLLDECGFKGKFENGECPHCNYELPLTVKEGDKCDNCDKELNYG
jgi:hypothetical protein